MWPFLGNQTHACRATIPQYAGPRSLFEISSDRALLKILECGINTNIGDPLVRLTARKLSEAAIAVSFALGSDET
jgi:hypothetical protein